MFVRISLLLSLFLLVAGCGGMVPKKSDLQVESSTVQINEKAVRQMMTHLAMSQVPSQETVSPAIETLLTFLAQTSPAELIQKIPNAQCEWRLDRIFIIDDCVAVRLTEGNYIETIFFVRNQLGWHIAARARASNQRD